MGGGEGHRDNISLGSDLSNLVSPLLRHIGHLQHWPLCLTLQPGHQALRSSDGLYEEALQGHLHYLGHHVGPGQGDSTATDQNNSRESLSHWLPTTIPHSGSQF